MDKTARPRRRPGGGNPGSDRMQQPSKRTWSEGQGRRRQKAQAAETHEQHSQAAGLAQTRQLQRTPQAQGQVTWHALLQSSRCFVEKRVRSTRTPPHSKHDAQSKRRARKSNRRTRAQGDGRPAGASQNWPIFAHLRQHAHSRRTAQQPQAPRHTQAGRESTQQDKPPEKKLCSSARSSQAQPVPWFGDMATERQHARRSQETHTGAVSYNDLHATKESPGAPVSDACCNSNSTHIKALERTTSQKLSKQARFADQGN